MKDFTTSRAPHRALTIDSFARSRFRVNRCDMCTCDTIYFHACLRASTRSHSERTFHGRVTSADQSQAHVTDRTVATVVFAVLLKQELDNEAPQVEAIKGRRRV